jgi:hypothetical protein
VTRRCSSPFRTELEAFKTSVNHQAISGDLARHARMEGTPPPSRALTLVEARQVISVMVKAWMDWLHAGRPPIPETPKLQLLFAEASRGAGPALAIPAA